MGSPVTEERKLFAALNNCAFVSTESIDKEDPAKPFKFLMDASMLGVGVGFDTKGAGKLKIFGVKNIQIFKYSNIQIFKYQIFKYILRKYLLS
jgi:hypothetical protein